MGNPQTYVATNPIPSSSNLLQTLFQRILYDPLLSPLLQTSDLCILSVAAATLLGVPETDKIYMGKLNRLALMRVILPPIVCICSPKPKKIKLIQLQRG